MNYVVPLCTRSQLPFVLKSHLCDSVRTDVELFDHDIDAMWKRLDLKYGNTGKLIDAILADLKKLPNCNVITDSTLDFIKLIETAYYKLSAINSLPELMNSMVFSAIEHCIPSVMYDEWIKEVACLQPASRFEKLLSFLEDWRHRIEYELSHFASKDNCLHCTSNASRATGNSRKCLIHRDCRHPIWRCRVFTTLPVKRRNEIVQSAGACTLCLIEGHDSSSCQKTYRCSIPGCSAKNNFLLHDDMKL